MDKRYRLAKAMEDMIVRMKEIDDRCADMTKDLAARDVQLISFIGERQAVIMRDIATFLNIPVSTATGKVDKLVNNKFLKRGHAEYDRRIVRIELDKKGKDLFNTFEDMRGDLVDRIINMLGEEESDQLTYLLEKISTGMYELIEA